MWFVTSFFLILERGWPKKEENENIRNCRKLLETAENTIEKATSMKPEQMKESCGTSGICYGETDRWGCVEKNEAAELAAGYHALIAAGGNLGDLYSSSGQEVSSCSLATCIFLVFQYVLSPAHKRRNSSLHASFLKSHMSVVRTCFCFRQMRCPILIILIYYFCL